MTTKRVPFRISAILVVVLVGLVVLPVECIIRERHKADQRLVHMLSETDYQALLNACRGLSQRVAAGHLESKPYRLRSPLPWLIRATRAPEAASFPEAILDLDPAVVEVDPYGLVRVLLQVYPDQGLLAYPENYRGHDQAGNVELIPGLWFSDGDYRPDSRSEFTKHVDELIQRGKDYQRAIRGDTGSRPEGAH